MGWVFYRDPPADERAEIISLFAPYHVEYLSKRGTTWYVAFSFEVCRPSLVENPLQKCTTAGIVLTKRYAGEWGYKTLDETAGPYQFDAPLKLLDLLSETDNTHALEWRQACRDRAVLRAKIRSIKDGDRIKLDSPLDFGSFEEDTFRAVDWKNYTKRGKTKRVYWAESARTHVRLTHDNLLSRQFEFLPREDA